MSEQERDEIDHEAKSIMKKCFEKIETLKEVLSKKLQLWNQIDEFAGELETHLSHSENSAYNIDWLSHFEGVIGFLFLRLQGVTQFYAELRNLRLKNAEDAKDGFVKLNNFSWY
jgi:hypothetical protein